MAHQTCIECGKPFESSASKHYLDNLCQECGDVLKSKPMGLVNKLVSEVVKRGGYKSSPPESGNNRCGKKKLG